MGGRGLEIVYLAEGEERGHKKGAKKGDQLKQHQAKGQNRDLLALDASSEKNTCTRREHEHRQVVIHHLQSLLSTRLGEQAIKKNIPVFAFDASTKSIGQDWAGGRRVLFLVWYTFRHVPWEACPISETWPSCRSGPGGPRGMCSRRSRGGWPAGRGGR